MGTALPLVGREVTQLQLDHRVGLLFDNGVLMTIESEIELAGATVQPGEARNLAPVLSLLHKRCTAVKAPPDGTLTIVFDDDVHLTVRPDPQYEAWAAVGADWRLVAMPGGGIAQWI